MTEHMSVNTFGPDFERIFNKEYVCDKFKDAKPNAEIYCTSYMVTKNNSVIMFQHLLVPYENI